MKQSVFVAGSFAHFSERSAGLRMSSRYRQSPCAGQGAFHGKPPISLGKPGLYAVFTRGQRCWFGHRRDGIDTRHDAFLSILAVVVHKDIPIQVMHRMTPRIAKRWGLSLWIEMGIADRK